MKGEGRMFSKVSKKISFAFILTMVLTLFSGIGAMKVNASTNFVETFSGTGSYSDSGSTQTGFENSGWTLMNGGGTFSSSKYYHITTNGEALEKGLKHNIGKDTVIIKSEWTNISSSGSWSEINCKTWDPATNSNFEIKMAGAHDDRFIEVGTWDGSSWKSHGKASGLGTISHLTTQVEYQYNGVGDWDIVFKYDIGAGYVTLASITETGYSFEPDANRYTHLYAYAASGSSIAVDLNLFELSDTNPTIEVIETFSGSGGNSDTGSLQTGFENSGWTLMNGGGIFESGNYYHITTNGEALEKGLKRNVRSSSAILKSEWVNISSSGSWSEINCKTWDPATNSNFEIKISGAHNDRFIEVGTWDGSSWKSHGKSSHLGTITQLTTQVEYKYNGVGDWDIVFKYDIGSGFVILASITEAEYPFEPDVNRYTYLYAYALSGSSISVDLNNFESIPPNPGKTIINGDFESGNLTGWNRNLSNKNDIAYDSSRLAFMKEGLYFYTTGFHKGGSGEDIFDKGKTGVLRSDEFIIDSSTNMSHLTMLVGGYNDVATQSVSLVRVSDNKVLLETTGTKGYGYITGNGGVGMRERTWDLRPFDGTTCYIEIKDDSPYGYITVDDFKAHANAYLSDIKVNGATISGFSEDVDSYLVVLSKGTTSVPTVTATAGDSEATKVITNATALPGTTKIVVTGRDGVTKKTYKVNFAVQDSTFLTNLSLSTPSDWSIGANGLVGTGNNIYSVSSETSTDFEYEGDIKLEAPQGGLIFRSANDPSNGAYIALLDAQADMVKLIKKATGKDDVVISTASRTLDFNGEVYRLKISAKGSNIRVYFEDEDMPLISATDESYSSGKFGLMISTPTKVTFNNVKYNEYIIISGAQSDVTTDIIPRVDIAENLYENWTPVYDSYDNEQSMPVTDNGHAFGYKPAQGAFSGQTLSGYEGKRLLNSKRRNLGTSIGEIQSDPFEIKGDRIDFLIAGGGSWNGQTLPTSVNLLVNGNRVLTSNGDFSNTMVRKSWDVSAYKGQTAVIQVIDYSPVESFGSPGWNEDNYGFILLDDIRQTDANGNRVDLAYDNAHNFNFEKVKDSSYRILPGKVSSVGDVYTQAFTIKTSGGAKVGVLNYTATKVKVNASTFRFDVNWSYDGADLENVKLEQVHRMPIGANDQQLYMQPGQIYNGNTIGEKAHYIGEDFPEDSCVIPCASSVEDSTRVFGGWVKPQQSGSEVKFSFRLVKNLAEDSWDNVYSLPESVINGRKYSLDQDKRMTISSSLNLDKSIYLYMAPKKTYTYVSNEKAGYGMVINEAWKELSPDAQTNVPHTLATNYQTAFSLISNSNSNGLRGQWTFNKETFKTWLTGRLAGFAPSSSDRYTGFGWSAEIEHAQYAMLKAYINGGKTNNDYLSLGTGGFDMFAKHGVSSSGVLYTTLYNEKDWGTFGPGIGDTDLGYLGNEIIGFIKCYDLLKDNDIAYKQFWMDAVKTTLDKIMEWYPQGDVPSRFNANNGTAVTRSVFAKYWWGNKYTTPYTSGGTVMFTKPSEGGPTGITAIIGAYVKYYQHTGDSTYLTYAEKLGDVVLNVLKDYGRLCGYEADYFNIDKRPGHLAVEAMNYLYEATSKQKWKEGLELTTNWFNSWQFAYNVNFDGLERTPHGHYDYRTIGGSPVDLKYNTQSSAYEAGAVEYLRAWKLLGDKSLFERARAQLHQGMQNTLTESKRNWLNDNYQGPAQDDFNDVTGGGNPMIQLDAGCIGGGSEDVVTSLSGKGNWTTRTWAISSMAMATFRLHSDDILKEFGSITYDFKWNDGGCLDALDNYSATLGTKTLSIKCRNMLESSQTYKLMLMNFTGVGATIDGTYYTKEQIAQGISIQFNNKETKTISISWE